MKTIYRIAKSELNSLFCSPIAWLVLVIFTFQMSMAFTDRIIWELKDFVINNRERHLAVHKEPVRMTVILFSSEVWKDWYNQDYLKPFFQRTEDFSNQIRKKEEGYDKLDQKRNKRKPDGGMCWKRRVYCCCPTCTVTMRAESI